MAPAINSFIENLLGYEFGAFMTSLISPPNSVTTFYNSLPRCDTLIFWRQYIYIVITVDQKQQNDENKTSS
jgi:hypothetical protein